MTWPNVALIVFAVLVGFLLGSAGMKNHLRDKEPPPREESDLDEQALARFEFALKEFIAEMALLRADLASLKGQLRTMRRALLH